MKKPFAAAVFLVLWAAPLPPAKATPTEDPPSGEQAEPRQRPDKGHSVFYTKGGCRIEEDWNGPSHSTQVICQQGFGRPLDQPDGADGDGRRQCPPDC